MAELLPTARFQPCLGDEAPVQHVSPALRRHADSAARCAHCDRCTAWRISSREQPLDRSARRIDTQSPTAIRFSNTREIPRKRSCRKPWKTIATMTTFRAIASSARHAGRFGPGQLNSDARRADRRVAQLSPLPGSRHARRPRTRPCQLLSRDRRTWKPSRIRGHIPWSFDILGSRINIKIQNTYFVCGY